MKTYDEKYNEALEQIKKYNKYGAKQLTGTEKQKKWAEVIRYEFLKEHGHGSVIEILSMHGKVNTSAFWIDSRIFTWENILDMIDKQKEASETLKTLSEKTKEESKKTKNLVKFYEGKELVGQSKEKKQAEKLRQDFLKSNNATDEEKQELLTCSEFVNDVEFWINNKSINSSNVKNIITKLQGFDALLKKLSSALSEKGLTKNKIEALDEIRDYLNNCDFYFNSPYKRP